MAVNKLGQVNFSKIEPCKKLLNYGSKLMEIY